MARLFSLVFTLFCSLGILLEAAPSIQCNTYKDLVKRNAALPDAKALQKRLKDAKPMLWHFLGDSITQGALHTFGYQCYVQLCEEMIRWEHQRALRMRDCVVNSGVSGDTLSRYEAEYDIRIHHLNAEVVFINYGVNDVRSNVSLEQYEKQLAKLVTDARAHGAIPVLQVPNPVKGMKARDAEFREAVRQLAEKEQCLLVDHPLYWEERGGKNSLFLKNWLTDSVHPNNLGHRAMAQAISESLQLVPQNSATMKLPLNGK